MAPHCHAGWVGCRRPDPRRCLKAQAKLHALTCAWAGLGEQRTLAWYVICLDMARGIRQEQKEIGWGGVGWGPFVFIAGKIWRFINVEDWDNAKARNTNFKSICIEESESSKNKKRHVLLSGGDPMNTGWERFVECGRSFWTPLSLLELKTCYEISYLDCTSNFSILAQ